MQQAFGTVLWIVVAVAGVAAVALLVRSGKTWEEHGKRGLLLDRDMPREPGPGSAAAVTERDTEIRDLLRASNARRARRREPPIDVDEEFARLTSHAPHVDPELRVEIRQLVLARNHRRVRAGKPPLDVDQEIEREIRDFGQL